MIVGARDRPSAVKSTLSYPTGTYFLGHPVLGGPKGGVTDINGCPPDIQPLTGHTQIPFPLQVTGCHCHQ